MKAYVISNKAALSPYQKPSSDIRLMGQTIGRRLRRQLSACGFQIIECDSLESLKPEARSIAVQDDVLLSAKFLARFLEAITTRERDFQLWMDTAKFHLFSIRDAAPVFRSMPVFYFGDQPKASHPERLELAPQVAFDTDEGMPQRIGDFTNLHVYFLDCYAVHVQYWFDLLIANGVYVREFLVERLRPFSRILPKRIIYRILANRWIREHSNSIGSGCRIHPKAILEGCIVGNGVEIGPYCYLRSSVIADRAIIRERSSIKLGYVGEGACVAGIDVTNCYIGSGSFILSSLVNVVIGERVFLAGGSGFTDFIFGAQKILVTIDGKEINSGQNFLGSAVGDDCFIGAGLGFAPGRTILNNISLMNNALIKNVPNSPNGAYIVSGNHLLQIPTSFTRG